MKTDEKVTKITEEFNFLTATITSMMDQTNNSKFSPAQKDTLNPPDPTTVVLDNWRAPTLDRIHSTKIGGMWTLKHYISSPKFYELFINTELKGDTALYLKKFYNHTKMRFNEMIRLREDLLPIYQNIKIHSEFAE